MSEEKKKIYEKSADGIFGLIVGDALGLPVDLRSREYLRQSPVTDFESFGTYNQEAGTWSDSSSLTLCAAETLISRYSREALVEKFILWQDTGYWTPNGELVGKWNCAVKVLSEFRAEQRGEIPQESDSTNFPVTWILPFAYLLHDYPFDRRIKTVQGLTSIFHSSLEEEIGAAIYVEYAVHLLNGMGIREALVAVQETVSSYYRGHEGIEKFSTILRGKIISLTEDDISASHDMVRFLTAVVWSILQNNSYRDSVLRAVNLGGDTDCLGAAVGGLAGIAYGYESIPPEWIAQLAGREKIEELITRFSERIRKVSENKEKKTVKGNHNPS